MKSKILIFVLFSGLISCTKKEEIIDTSLPSNPLELTTKLIGKNKILLNWKETSTNERGFKIERKEPGGNFQLIATLAENAVSFIDSGLLFKKTYSYRIYSYNSLGNSPNYTNESSFLSTYPLLPTSLQNNVISFYPFDNNTVDLISNNNAFLNLVYPSSNKFNQNSSAYQLNGIGSYIKITNTNSLNTSSATIYAWFLHEEVPPSYRDSLNTYIYYSNIISKGNFGCTIIADNVDEKLYNRYRTTTNGTFRNYSGKIQKNTWHSFALTMQPNDSTRIYVDENPKSIQAKYNFNNSFDFIFGDTTTSSFNKYQVPFKGKIDNLLIFNRALTKEEIQQLTDYLNVVK